MPLLCMLKIHKWKHLGGIFYEEQCERCGLIKEYHSAGSSMASWEEYHYPNQVYDRNEIYERDTLVFLISIGVITLFCFLIWAGIVFKPCFT